MKKRFYRWFCQHPKTVGETYGEHFVFAASFAGILIFAAGAALIHGLIPALCETTASRAVDRLARKLQTR